MKENVEMLDYIKALADGERLKIVGLLVQKPASLEEIGSGLSMQVREAFNHLAFLKFAGIVIERDGIYELKADGPGSLARRQFEGRDPIGDPHPGLSADQQKELGKYLKADGSLRQVPNSRTQAGRFKIVLEYLQAAFETDVIYSEKEVNTIIRRFHEDVSGLRRDLVDANLLARERDGSKYWRTVKPGGK